MAQHAPAVFLPGILMPAAVRYAPLRAELGGSRTMLTKELEVYAGDEPPLGYSLRSEVDGLERFLDEHDLGELHLYGHSAGGSIALAYVAEHPERVLSLALDEPASDFTDEDRQAIAVELPAAIEDLPVPERMVRFARSLVREGVELPAPPPPTGAEMAKRPAGLVAFRRALSEHRLDRRAVRAFRRPAYFSYGSLSNARWERMAERIEVDLQQCTVERYDGVHHLRTSHQAEPARVAAALEQLWVHAEAARDERSA